MTAFQAPIFLSLPLARKWVNLQSLDEQLFLCRIYHHHRGREIIRFEFLSNEDILNLETDRPTITNYHVIESWH